MTRFFRSRHPRYTFKQEAHSEVSMKVKLTATVL